MSTIITNLFKNYKFEGIYKILFKDADKKSA